MDKMMAKENVITPEGRKYAAPGRWTSRNGGYGYDAFYGRPIVERELTPYEQDPTSYVMMRFPNGKSLPAKPVKKG